MPGRIVILLACTVALVAAEVRLQSPLTTILPVSGQAEGPCILVARLVLPVDAPADLGVGAFACDRHGRWYQTLHPGPLAPGSTIDLRLPLDGGADLVAEPDRSAWGPAAAAVAAKRGLFFWSSAASRCRLEVTASLEPGAASIRPGRLLDLRLDGAEAGGTARAVCGRRWELSLRPDPYPANPYDPADFALDAVFTHASGATWKTSGFHRQPFRSRDGGDHEHLDPDGPAAFAVRFRPGLPGAWTCHLTARWREGGSATLALPLLAEGAVWDGYVRPDAADPRFFAAGGRLGPGTFVWPVGLNLRSVWDVRGRDQLGTRLTPDRGTLAYAAFFDRLAAGGGDAAEVWLSSWNLALEWNAAWPGFHGAGRYSEENAWRLDRVLDLAEAHGIRINLVVNNHGQASERTDREWDLNPYNVLNGGQVQGAAALFSDPWAWELQERFRRHLVARLGDHPALLGWKLWSEVNLTSGRGEALRDWHRRAAASFAALDPAGRAVSTHWSGNYRNANQAVAALPELGYLCIDAYHGPEGQFAELAELLWQSTNDPAPGRGLGMLRKPILVTEFGGNWNACSEAQLEAEHASAPWVALVSGHAGGPMLWWFEWVDQGDRYAPYGSVRRFLAGEDLRSPDAKAAEPWAESGDGPLWARAWVRRGRLLAYVLDRAWGAGGDASREHRNARLRIGEQVSAGPVFAEWWDADRGVALPVRRFAHPGGPLELPIPPFRRHCALKLWREDLTQGHPR